MKFENTYIIKIRDCLKSNAKRIITITSVTALLGVGVLVFTGFSNFSIGDSQNQSAETQNQYKEEIVTRSDIVVGVTETGSASLFETAITFDFETVVLEVLANAGKYVNIGDVIATIDPDSFDELYAEAQEALYDAQLKLQTEQLAAQTQTLQAEQAYNTDIATGNSAQTIYDLSIAELEASYNSILTEISTLESEKTSLESQISTGASNDFGIPALEAEIATLDADITAKTNELATAQAAVDNKQSEIVAKETELSEEQGKDVAEQDATLIATLITDIATLKADLTTLQSALLAPQTELNTLNTQKTEKEKELQTAEQNQSTYTQLSDDLEKTTSELSQKYTERDSAAATMELKKLEIQGDYDTDIQNYNNAAQDYSTTISTINNSLAEQEEIVEDLETELLALASIATDGSVVATVSGYIMEISDVGTEIRENVAVATIADSSKINVYVSIPQEDIADIEIDMPVNIVFDAYEDIIVSSTVSSISITPSAGMQSSVNYTIGILCDISAYDDMVIFESMTADVTFVEKQVTDALVVSNKCITLIDGKQYVKVQTADGTIENVEVTTGFSDGFDVEITSGLQEGDVVLIESVVTQNAT